MMIFISTAPSNLGVLRAPNIPRQTVHRTLHAKGADATQWSSRAMARGGGLSRDTSGRISNAFSLQPYRAGTFKLSADSLFVENSRGICDLHLSSPDLPLALCVDEKSLDNYRTYKHPRVSRWLARRPRYHPNFTSYLCLLARQNGTPPRHLEPQADPPRLLGQRSRPDLQDQPPLPALQRQSEAVSLDKAGDESFETIYAARGLRRRAA